MNYHKPLCLVKVRDDSVREDEQHKVVGRLPTVGLGYKTVLWIQIHGIWIRIWIQNVGPIWIKGFC